MKDGVLMIIHIYAKVSEYCVYGSNPKKRNHEPSAALRLICIYKKIATEPINGLISLTNTGRTKGSVIFKVSIFGLEYNVNSSVWPYDTKLHYTASSKQRHFKLFISTFKRNSFI